MKSVLNAIFDSYRVWVVFLNFVSWEPLITWLNFKNAAQKINCKFSLQVLCELLKENIMNNLEEEMRAGILCHAG